MTKSVFGRHVLISSLLTAIAIAIIVTFCILMFDKYSYTSGENTSTEIGTVSDVYYATGIKAVMVEMSDGNRFQLEYPNFPKELYSKIGYDHDELCELLKGKEIEYRRMDRLPWIVEIRVGDVLIDNNELTNKQITATRIGIVIIGLLMLAFPIAGDFSYLKNKYRLYQKAEKKIKRKAQRELKKTIK